MKRYINKLYSLVESNDNGSGNSNSEDVSDRYREDDSDSVSDGEILEHSNQTQDNEASQIAMLDSILENDEVLLTTSENITNSHVQ